MREPYLRQQTVAAEQRLVWFWIWIRSPSGNENSFPRFVKRQNAVAKQHAMSR